VGFVDNAGRFSTVRTCTRYVIMMMKEKGKFRTNKAAIKLLCLVYCTVVPSAKRLLFGSKNHELTHSYSL
jgi:hypothetical protein